MKTETELTIKANIIKNCSEQLRIKQQNDWAKSFEGEVASEEKEVQKLNSRKALVIFSETECGKIKVEFLNSYLQSSPNLKKKFKKGLLSFFSMGEFAVLAVRQNSKEAIELALQSFEFYIKQNNEYRDEIVGLTLISNSLLQMGLNADNILAEFASHSENASVKKQIADFISRNPKDKTLWCMGYEVNTEKPFGFIWIGGDSDYLAKKPKQKWWKFW